MSATTPRTDALLEGMVMSEFASIDALRSAQAARLEIFAGKLERENAALLAALHGMLEDEGLHSVGCKEFPPGHDDSRCCPVHIARAAIAATHVPKPPSP